MKTNKLVLILGLFSYSIFSSSCTKDPDTLTATPIDTLANSLTTGVFIINEGNFGVGNASIDFYRRDSNLVIKNVFETVNARPLGDVAQSMAIFRSKGYIVMNGSAKVEVINAKTFQSVASVIGFSSPRYFVGTEPNTGYVSDWVSNSIKEINLTTNLIVNSITVGTGPEGMIKVGNFLYVANCGAYGIDSTVSVIDLTSKTEVKKIIVGDAPISFSIDAQNQLWVLCRGDYGSFSTLLDDTQGKLVKINTSNNTISTSVLLGQIGDHPDKLAISKDKTNLFYNSSYGGLVNGIFKLGINETTSSTSPYITGYFYGIGIDPVDGSIYAADPIDFNQSGNMLRFNANTGVLVDSFSVGIIPNGIHVE